MRVNLGLVHLQRSEFPEALHSFTDALAMLEKNRFVLEASMVRAMVLPCLAAAADWPGWDQCYEAMTARQDHPPVDADVAAALQLAGEQAIAHNQPRRAHRVLTLAHEQWFKLERTDEAAAVQSVLKGL